MKKLGAVAGFLIFSLVLLHSVAAPPAPPVSEIYDVRISYRINAFRNERLSQYGEMMRYLKKLGFQRDPQEEVSETEPEEIAHTRINGSIPGRRAHDLLNERHIRSIQLIPHGAKVPEDKTARVRVEIELFDGLTPEQQYRLSRQTFEVLAGLSFFEAVAYDTRGFTRLVGTMPLSNVETLLTDLRQQPAGQKMPGPFKNVWSVRASIVSPEMPPPAPRPRLPKVPPEQENLSPDLRQVLGDAATAAKPMRMEVILAGVPDAEDKSFPRLLRAAAPGLVVEGRLGPLVTVLANPAQAPALAALPIVIGVRLPRLPQPFRPTANGNPTRWQPLLDASGAARLQAMGRTGRGTRLAVVDSDFRGWKSLIGKGTLPDDTRLVDWTAERNVDLLPDPFLPGDGPGAGTQRALTIARLAPEINLTLIRIDPASPYMLDEVARAINGDDVHSINLDNRLADIQADRDALDKRRDQLAEERREILGTFPNPDESQQRLLKEAEEKNLTPDQIENLDAFKNMEQRERASVLYRVRQRIYDRDARAFGQRLERYFQQKQNIQSLRGIRVVASALSWHDGYPVDGTSALSRYFDDRPFRAALWFQAAGDTRGQSWSGLFRDADGNGILEFADLRPPTLPSPPGGEGRVGGWTPELDFLTWQTPKGQTMSDIPASARLRLSLQWSEAHDPLYAATGEDPYRLPLARNMRIFLLRQLDPTGKRQPADDMEIVAQSVDTGMRLSATPNSAIYEIALDVQIKDAGRYAVAVGGIAPDSIYPPGDPTLPFMRKRSEMHVRLFVAPLDASGCAIFHDYATAAGSLGMPADAQTAITVGAANLNNKRQPYSGGGAPFGLALLAKPDMLAYDLGEGTAESAAFAAGLAALVPLAGRSPAACLQNLQVLPGGVLRIPEGPPDR